MSAFDSGAFDAGAFDASAASQVRVYWLEVEAAAGGTLFNQAVASTITLTGTAVKQVSKLVAGVTTLAGSLIKSTAKTFTGVTTAVSAVRKVVAKPFASSITLASTVVRAISKHLASTATLTATVVKHTTKTTFVSSITTTAGPVVSGAINVAIGGSILLTATLTDTIQYVRAYVATITLSGNFAKAMTMFVSGAITLIGSSFKTTLKNKFTGVITMVSALDEMFFTPIVSNTFTRGMRWMRKYIGRR